MIKTPCEQALWKILPSLRREIVVYMIEKKGIPRKQVAKIMGITPAAISQYMKKKRGMNDFTNKQLSEIEEVADNIVESGNYEKGIVKGICKLCKIMEVGCK